MRRTVFALSFLGAALWGSLAFAACPTGGAIEIAIYGCPTTTPPYASSLRIPVAPSATTGALEYITADTLVDTTTTQTIAGKTLTNPTISGATFSGTIAGTPTYSGVPLYTGIISGTVVSGGFLGLDSGNHLVKATPAGAGNVTGPGSSVNTNFACWNGTTGTLLSDCGYNTSHFLVTTNNLSDVANAATARNNLLGASAGGTPTRYLGLDGSNLVVTGTPAGGSGVTSIATTAPLAGGTITTTGTLSIAGPSNLTTFTAGTVPMGAGASAFVASEIADVASGGVTVGSPTGGQKGAGTINMTGCFINNVPCAAGSSVAWSSITGGTNNAAALVVGTGASLAPSGSGAITATVAPVSGLTGAGAGVLTFLATPTSANLASALTDETGSGAAVFGTSPTMSGVTVTSSFTATGLVTNADLTNSSMTVNGTTCTLGASCAPSGGSNATVATGISAAGSSQGTATALTTDWAEVSTVTAGQGVVQETPVAGKSQMVANNSNATLLIYPVSGATFDSLSANAAVSVGAGARVLIFCLSTTHCDTK